MKKNEPNQIMEEQKYSEVQENLNVEDSDESLDEEPEIDDFNDKPPNKKEIKIEELEYSL